MFIQPMLLETAEQPFSDSKYIYELKADGHRAIISSFDKELNIFTRNNNKVTYKYPELHHPLIEASDYVLDGEIIVLSPEGLVDFELF